jgi:hypothetical protein
MMETGLLQIQAENLQELREVRQLHPDTQELLYGVFGRGDPAIFHHNGESFPQAILPASAQNENDNVSGEPGAVDPVTELARCFLRLAHLPSGALDRLSRYEATLWRQVGQILFMLDALDRRKPQERRGTHQTDSSGRQLMGVSPKKPVIPSTCTD